MSTILLVRHGQASYGAADYDDLSPMGAAQAEAVGSAMRAAEVRPVTVLSGSLRRQRDTARSLIQSAAWSSSIETDYRWNEFSYLGLSDGAGSMFGGVDSRSFQDVLECAMGDWVEGRPTRFSEDFVDFDRRTRAALDAVADSGPGDHLAVTSAGVISWIAAVLLGGGVDQWVRLNRVCVNASITKIVHGRRGLSLISFNDHSHLSHDLLSYR